MVSTLDQIFVLLKHWIVGLLPHVVQPVAGVLISVVAIIAVFPACSPSPYSSSARDWGGCRIASVPIA